MKKFLAIILALVISFTFIACNTQAASYQELAIEIVEDYKANAIDASSAHDALAALCETMDKEEYELYLCIRALDSSFLLLELKPEESENCESYIDRDLAILKSFN